MTNLGLAMRGAMARHGPASVKACECNGRQTGKAKKGRKSQGWAKGKASAGISRAATPSQCILNANVSSLHPPLTNFSLQSRAHSSESAYETLPIRVPWIDSPAFSCGSRNTACSLTRAESQAASTRFSPLPDTKRDAMRVSGRSVAVRSSDEQHLLLAIDSRLAFSYCDARRQFTFALNIVRASSRSRGPLNSVPVGRASLPVNTSFVESSHVTCLENSLSRLASRFHNDNISSFDKSRRARFVKHFCTSTFRYENETITTRRCLA